MKISVYIPLYNGGAWCREVPLLDGVHYIASDNGSTDESAEILEARGVTVIRQPVSLGRVGNWRFCIAHFQDSGADWMKWMFTGDRLRPDAADILRRAAAQFPDARQIISEFDIVEGDNRTRHSMLPTTALIEPARAMQLAAQLGNWFGSPIGYALHREARVEECDFGSLPYVADYQFAMNIAARHPTLYLAENIGDFVVDARRYYKTQSESQQTAVQNAWMMWQSAERFHELTGDRTEYERLARRIETEVAGEIFDRMMRSPVAGDYLDRTSYRAIASLFVKKLRRRRRK
ncbi:hypothetical protein CCAX7_009370 [Capsulimonas corticalis]|uniref:Uncharacterized protein n=1 Tax=Capsulimonas corticalis TaxID=2219043 RepID=A0A402CU72_9BACT|nr:hypothetical protein [Capsulimonas corticalis]BDI28886.1 hypothetical protein CCAX7_009370 [Capsulimonas corticalis]